MFPEPNDHSFQNSNNTFYNYISLSYPYEYRMFLQFSAELTWANQLTILSPSVLLSKMGDNRLLWPQLSDPCPHPRICQKEVSRHSEQNFEHFPKQTGKIFFGIHILIQFEHLNFYNILHWHFQTVFFIRGQANAFTTCISMKGLLWLLLQKQMETPSANQG